MYPEYLVAPMRQDLTKVGFEELKDADAVKQAIESKGTVFIMVNSVCGCAAANARPAAQIASRHDKHPDKLVTVFAGMEKERDRLDVQMSNRGGGGPARISDAAGTAGVRQVSNR